MNISFIMFAYAFTQIWIFSTLLYLVSICLHCVLGTHKCVCVLHIFTNGNSALFFSIVEVITGLGYVCACARTHVCVLLLYVYHMKCLKLPHVLLHSTIHSISVLKTHSHTLSTQPPAPPPGHCSFAFHIVFLSFFFCFFICHKRNKLLLHVPQSYYCGYRCHVLIIMCIVSIMSAFPRFPLSPFHSHSGIFICQFYICISQSLCLSLRLSTTIIPLHFQLILLSFMLYSLLLLLSCQMI